MVKMTAGPQHLYRRIIYEMPMDSNLSRKALRARAMDIAPEMTYRHHVGGACRAVQEALELGVVSVAGKKVTKIGQYPQDMQDEIQLTDLRLKIAHALTAEVLVMPHGKVIKSRMFLKKFRSTLTKTEPGGVDKKLIANTWLTVSQSLRHAGHIVRNSRFAWVRSCPAGAAYTRCPTVDKPNLGVSATVASCIHNAKAMFDVVGEPPKPRTQPELEQQAPNQPLPNSLTALQIGDAVSKTIHQQQETIGRLSAQLREAQENKVASEKVKILEHQIRVIEGRNGWLTKRAKEAEDKCADAADQVIIYERRILELTEQLRRLVRQPAIQLSVLGLSQPNNQSAVPDAPAPGGNGEVLQ